MANYLVTPNMQMPNPVPGVDPGPDYATNLSNSLNIVDAHNHSPGNGVLINPNGLDINDDLPFNGNNATLLRSTRFSTQVSPLALASDIGCLYVSGVDLYYNDINGNQIQVTASGAVNASVSGIVSGTASAAFSAGVLVVKSSSTSGANVLMKSLQLTNSGNLTNILTLAAPTLAGSVSQVLPVIPGATSFMQMDTSGVMSASVAVSGGITASNIAAGLLPPAGMITAYGGAAPPTGWLLCDGSSLLQASYPALFTAIGVAYGSVDGTHFNVPDLRGQFLRGVSGASTNDPDKLTRTAMATGGNTGNNVGSVQSSAFASHQHQLFLATASSNGSNAQGSNAVNTSATNTELTGGNETRPINAYVNYIIKV